MTPKQFKAHRERLGMSQSEMAAALGLKHKSQVHYMETGRFAISGPEELVILQLQKPRHRSPADPADYPPAKVRRIRQALGLTLAEFAGRLGLASHTQAAHLENGRTRVNWAKAI